MTLFFQIYSGSVFHNVLNYIYVIKLYIVWFIFFISFPKSLEYSLHIQDFVYFQKIKSFDLNACECIFLLNLILHIYFSLVQEIELYFAFHLILVTFRLPAFTFFVYFKGNLFMKYVWKYFTSFDIYFSTCMQNYETLYIMMSYKMEISILYFFRYCDK